MFSTIEECISYIENQIPQKIDLSLERIEKAAKLLGNPEKKYKTIHVTGTNGKGSTSSFTTQLLASQGLCVGFFSSPHLLSYTERIRINNHEISEQEFIALVEQFVQHIFPHVQLTIFETLTLMGFLYFANQNVDVAVIEVGLGGRFDATNIITPQIAAITNIGIDHVHFLSNDVRKIAQEKAGIFKKGAVCLYTVEAPELQSIVKQFGTEEYVAPYIHYTPTESGFHIQVAHASVSFEAEFPMFGAHQIRNLELALEMTIRYFILENRDVNVEILREQIKTLHWAGRMERLQPRVYFDGAHNSAGIDALIHTIEKHFSKQKVAVVFSVMADKDYRSMIEQLDKAQCIDQLYFLALPGARALQKIESDFNLNVKITEITFDNVNSLTNQHDIVIFAGSLYGYEHVVKQFR